MILVELGPGHCTHIYTVNIVSTVVAIHPREPDATSFGFNLLLEKSWKIADLAVI